MNAKHISHLAAQCLLLIVSGSLLAATPPGAKTNRHSLWQVKGKNATVFLLGSVHFLQASNYPLAQPIEKAFAQSQIVAFETDIDVMKSPEAQKKLLSKAMLPEGETLQKNLSPAVYRDFTNYLEKAGIPPMVLERFRPGMAAVTLTVLELQGMGIDPSLGVDQHFHKRAKEADKKLIALETVDFQIDMLTGLTGDDGEALMKATLKEVAKTRAAFRDIIQAWESGDSEALVSLMNEAMADSPSIYKRMITDRNRQWIPKIVELTKGDKDAIVIVGAGHLVGKDSVVDLLKKQGISPVQQ